MLIENDWDFYEKLISHLYHNIQIVPYAMGAEISVECAKCGVVLVTCPRPETEQYITCSICRKRASARTAHLHQGEWIGEECWDERLRSSE